MYSEVAQDIFPQGARDQVLEPQYNQDQDLQLVKEEEWITKISRWQKLETLMLADQDILLV